VKKIALSVAGAILITGFSAPLAFAATSQGSAPVAAAVSPACTAANNTAEQDEAAFDAAYGKFAPISSDEQALEDSISLAQQQSDIKQEIAGLSSQESTVEKTLDSLGKAAGEAIFTGENPAKGLLLDALGYEVQILGAKAELANVETQIRALQPQLDQAESENDPPGAIYGLGDTLKSQADAAHAAWQAAKEAAQSACQETTTPTATPASGSPTTTPTATPASGSPTTTPSGNGSTQQYYQNGVNFVIQNLGPPVGEGVSAQTACTQTEAADTFPQVGSDDYDSGPTSADQAAWISGCEAGLGANTPTSPAAITPAATPSTTPSADGSTQQYYTNGFNFAGNGTVVEGSSAQAECTGAENSASVMPVAGSDVGDSGPTAADQAAWLSGCEAAAEANTPTSPTADPAATTPAATGSPAPAATGSPAGSPNS
jgi:hypothetical protein